MQSKKVENGKVAAIVHEYGDNPDSLISILQDIQTDCHYLRETDLREVAKLLGLPLIQVYGVATFFRAFSLKPRGKHTVRVCLGTACHVRGAHSVLDEAKRRLNIEPDESTEDMNYTLETVNCLGACAQGPIVTLDDKYYGQMSPNKVRGIFKK